MGGEWSDCSRYHFGGYRIWYKHINDLKLDPIPLWASGFPFAPPSRPVRVPFEIFPTLRNGSADCDDNVLSFSSSTMGCQLDRTDLEIRPDITRVWILFFDPFLNFDPARPEINLDRFRVLLGPARPARFPVKIENLSRSHLRFGFAAFAWPLLAKPPPSLSALGWKEEGPPHRTSLRAWKEEALRAPASHTAPAFARGRRKAPHTAPAFTLARGRRKVGLHARAPAPHTALAFALARGSPPTPCLRARAPAPHTGGSATPYVQLYGSHGWDSLVCHADFLNIRKREGLFAFCLEESQNRLISAVVKSQCNLYSQVPKAFYSIPSGGLSELEINLLSSWRGMTRNVLQYSTSVAKHNVPNVQLVSHLVEDGHDDYGGGPGVCEREEGGSGCRSGEEGVLELLPFSLMFDNLFWDTPDLHLPAPLATGVAWSVEEESRFLAYREFSALPSRITLPTTTGISFRIRHLGTVSQPEKAVSEDGSVAFTDTVQPQRIKFKRLDKTARHIMNILDKEEVEKVKGNRDIPDIKPGYIVQLKVEVPENKRRVSTLKGIVIAKRNAGLQTTFRLRRMVAGVGVESVFPLYSPNIKEMKVLDKKDVRRAKLYYLRDRMNALKHK
ncbi:hypothetical protein Taro_007005 [Colocasia esculenta]|uniref:Ribosomal protein L19 n=1 Tax=Colocasia esculenta TaxID=4460 RepID=A0A843TSW4_COLES|nr:hypothetical protein [Colocasia esculenta]